jgi:predicted transcriptional regulator
MPGYTYIGKLKNSFICDKSLTPYDVRVFLALKKWETWNKPISIEAMSKEIGMTRKSFSKSIKTLEDLKYIKIERNTNWDCNKYHILNKANGNEIPTDGDNIPVEGNEIPINEGNEIPILIIPIGNTPIKEKKVQKKESEDLPDWLNKEAWAEWVQYRKEIRKTLKPTTTKKQISFLEKYQDDHVEIINRSITNGWTGMFPLTNGATDQDAIEKESREREERINEAKRNAGLT